MVLCIDIGNSNIVLGGYKGDEACFLARMTTNRVMEADQYAVYLKGMLEMYDALDEGIEGVMMASVVPALTPVLVHALKHFSPAPPHLLSLADAGDVHVAIDNPRELGMDILASAISVRHTRPLPAVIIDMGTATKLTALDADGRVPGVAIAPGLFVSLEALLRQASLLQGISLDAPSSAIGSNTADSMRSGVVLGSAAMLDGLIDRFAQEMGGLETVVATGGAAQIVIPHCRRDIEISDTLLLDGLMAVYRARCGGE
ncbi:MAG: type III pantothenate kinase [Oscillospiraceae bacterium]